MTNFTDAQLRALNAETFMFIMWEVARAAAAKNELVYAERPGAQEQGRTTTQDRFCSGLIPTPGAVIALITPTERPPVA